MTEKLRTHNTYSSSASNYEEQERQQRMQLTAKHNKLKTTHSKIKNFCYNPKSDRQSDETQSTENPSSNTLLTPDLPPASITHHQQHFPLVDQSNLHLASPRNTNLTTTTGSKNSKKFKPTTPLIINPQEPPTHKLNSKRQLNHHHTTPHLHPLQSTPKRQKTEPIRQSSTIHQPQISTRRAPIPAAPPPDLFFTTSRYTTPGKEDPSINTIGNGEPLEPTPRPHSSANSKGKGKEKTRQISNHKSRTHSRSDHPPDGSSSDDQNHHPHKLASSSSQSHTPRQKRNPHIYGRQDQQTDGEMSLITAETPMHHKNRQFRRGGGPTGKQKADQAGLGLGPGTPLSSQSLQVFDSKQGSARRGSRASSIGSGYEALPHPRILPSMLCRHVRTDLPPSSRCRTLLSWCSQKAEHVTYTVLNPTFKPTRYIFDELPKPLARTLSQLEPFDAGAKSKLLAKVAKSTLKNFIQGICENQVEISWGAGLPLDSDEDQEVSIENLSILDLQTLPPHPQDLKNERKIQELNNWRTRMSYEDHARQYQLNRYGRLIEKLTEESEPTPEDLLRSNRFHRAEHEEKKGDEDGLRVDTKLLTDRAAILEFGRFLRSRPAPPPKSIDVLDELGIDWSEIKFNIGMISEEMDRVEEELSGIEERMRRMQLSSTLNLKQVSLEGMISAIESKILLSSMDGVQLCMKSMNLNQSHLPSSSETLPGSIGKRDLLRTLSRSTQLP